LDGFQSLPVLRKVSSSNRGVTPTRAPVRAPTAESCFTAVETGH
jgi:hypothetical protein